MTEVATQKRTGLRPRIIPILLLRNGRCVKGRQFKNFRDTGAPVTAAKIYDAQRVDELVFLDIMASREGRNLLLGIVTQTARQCFMPLAVGGGLKTLEDIQTVLAAGADKVIINTAAVENPEFVASASKYFGKANIVVSIDYKMNARSEREVFTHGGTRPTSLDPMEWAKRAEALGAGEIIFTSIDREGTMTGYDLEFIKQATQVLGVPVVVHGGAGTLEHLREGILVGKASAVAAASIFHFTDQSPIKARYYLTVHGIHVRN